MQVLLIGGSGYVGARVNAFLKQRHTLRVFDLKPPADPSLEYRQGSVTDFESLRRAVEGMETVLYMAMNIQRGTEIEMAVSSFDVNVKGVYLALRAAREADIRHAVYCSSMSVYDGVLEYRNGFQAFQLSGDYENKVMNMDKARRLLDWEPLARPRG